MYRVFDVEISGNSGCLSDGKVIEGLSKVPNLLCLENARQSLKVRRQFKCM